MTQKDMSGKLLRLGLGLPETATDAEVKAACKGRSAEEICDAVNCRCVMLLAEGAPGLTADVPIDVILTPEVLRAWDSEDMAATAEQAAKRNAQCCGLDDYCSHGAQGLAHFIATKDCKKK